MLKEEIARDLTIAALQSPIFKLDPQNAGKQIAELYNGIYQSLTCDENKNAQEPTNVSIAAVSSTQSEDEAPQLVEMHKLTNDELVRHFVSYCNENFTKPAMVY